MSAKKGSVTIFLALAVFTFLTFCMVLVEGTRIYFFRVQALQAMELAEFSVLSEFQQEIFEKYHLFFLDLDYEQGKESVGILESRASHYLMKNTDEIHTKTLVADEFCRATDNDGSAFFEQAVAWMKLQKGFIVFEKLFEKLDGIEMEELDLEAVDQPKLEEKIPLPNISFPSIRALTEAVFGETNDLSEKSINLAERISKRSLQKGQGKKSKFNVADMQLFHGYIFENCSYYGSEKSDVWNEVLLYQIEYIISGKSSDRKNLENIMWKIFLLRAGGNYLFYHQDAGHLSKAQAEAVTLVGFLGNAALIEIVKELFLISQAIEDGVTETKQIFAGDEVPVYQKGFFSGLEFGYQEYLGLFLNAMHRTDKIYRTMDVIELEIRNQSEYKEFRWDHCVDQFKLRWNYQFPSLFTEVPAFAGGIYEHEIVRKIYYEK